MPPMYPVCTEATVPPLALHFFAVSSIQPFPLQPFCPLHPLLAL